MLQRLSANGSVAAWQEASLGCEVNGLRLADVRVNVGTPVKRGQLLAEFARETPLAEQAQVRAALAEAEAAWQEAHANAERARSVEGTGAISAQQIGQYFSAEASTQARVLAAQANLTVADLNCHFEHHFTRTIRACVEIFTLNHSATLFNRIDQLRA